MTKKRKKAIKHENKEVFLFPSSLSLSLTDGRSLADVTATDWWLVPSGSARHPAHVIGSPTVWGKSPLGSTDLQLHPNPRRESDCKRKNTQTF